MESENGNKNGKYRVLAAPYTGHSVLHAELHVTVF